MFSVDYTKHADRFLPLIDGEPRVLLFDVVPILFTGKNKYGNYNIGSSVDEHCENDVERYFHIIVSRSDFRDYHAQKISYLDLLKASPTIYLVDKYNETGEQKVSNLTFSEIPKEYVPTSQTYFPESAYEPTYVYITKLSGGIADDNLAYAEDVSKLQNSVVAFFHKGLNTLRKILQFEMETKLRPATESSYAVNYEVKITNYPEIYVKEKDLFGFLNDFSNFCIEHLPDEVETVLNLANDDSDSEFEKLFLKVLGLVPRMDKADEKQARAEVKESLRNDILATTKILAPIAEVAKKYGKVEFDNSSNLPIATIKSDFSETLNIVLEKVDVKIVDEKVKPFEILVYSFNKHTGKGKAELMVDKQVSSINFHIPRYKKGEEVKMFLESMYENRYVFVNGQMTFRSGSPVHLDIER